jgi:hypothetical protein
VLAIRREIPELGASRYLFSGTCTARGEVSRGPAAGLGMAMMGSQPRLFRTATPAATRDMWRHSVAVGEFASLFLEQVRGQSIEEACAQPRVSPGQAKTGSFLEPTPELPMV